MENLQIVYQDRYFVAVNKPSGLLVHRSKIDRCERQFAMQMVRDQVGSHVYPVHRLDKATSGVLLFALSSQAASKISENFRKNETQKTYLAIVRGHAGEGTIDRPLKEKPDRMIDSKARKGKKASPALTRYRELAAIEIPEPVGCYPTARYSLVAAYPKTGRRHQIRRHLRHISHPIIGDTTHGDGKHNRFFRERFQSHRLLLAAVELAFIHPYTASLLTINAPPEESFLDVVYRLGWDKRLLP